MNLLKNLEKMRVGPHRKDREKYCLHHDDHGHLTRECLHFKDEIEGLIRNGFVKEYVGRPRSNRKELRPPKRDQSSK